MAYLSLGDVNRENHESLLRVAMFDAGQMISKLEWNSNETGKPMYYQNQKDVASRLIEFGNYNAFLVCAHCQSGKTGIILALFCELMKNDKSFDPRNFYVITGDDSHEWIKQMENRFTKQWCEERVFKRCGGKLKSKDGLDFKEVISEKNDIYIIIDEIHLVTGKNMTISKMLEGSGIETESDFVDRNIKVVGLSATPGEVYSAFNDFWATYRWLFIKMEPETNYKGLHYFKRSDRIRQCHPVIKGNIINQAVIDDIWRIITDIPFKTINFIRIPRSKKNGMSLDEIKTEIKMKLSDKFHEEVNVELFTQSTSASLDETIKGLDLDYTTKEPKFHSFILLVDKFRVSKTLEDPRYLGVMYDRSSNKPSVVIQSFAGRMCGYKSNDYSILFTDVNIVKEYLKRWDEDCFSILSNGKNNTWVAGVGECEHTSVPENIPPESNIVKYIPIYLKCNDECLFSSLRSNKNNPAKKVEILRTFLFKENEKNKQIIDVLDTREIKEFQEARASTTIGRFETIKKNAIEKKEYCDTISFKNRNWDTSKCCTITWKEGEIVFNIFDIIENPRPNN